ncbi:hypothetical protein EV702DRAFT_112558 [Suillus placidus]|uniref:Uncharacterized protein n=1 Tax=Suillus placidus TaxID=48579 RepID=A0A9P6ZZF9_9AGAM|nr:hypothetical protein EV702DRAFT_112558 [Suillus placidus]
MRTMVRCSLLRVRLELYVYGVETSNYVLLKYNGHQHEPVQSEIGLPPCYRLLPPMCNFSFDLWMESYKYSTDINHESGCTWQCNKSPSHKNSLMIQAYEATDKVCCASTHCVTVSCLTSLVLCHRMALVPRVIGRAVTPPRPARLKRAHILVSITHA